MQCNHYFNVQAASQILRNFANDKNTALCTSKLVKTRRQLTEFIGRELSVKQIVRSTIRHLDMVGEVDALK